MRWRMRRQQARRTRRIMAATAPFRWATWRKTSRSIDPTRTLPIAVAIRLVLLADFRPPRGRPGSGPRGPFEPREHDRGGLVDLDQVAERGVEDLLVGVL